MPTPKPFRISVPDSKLQQLKQKLELSAFPDELEDAGWDYGTPLADVKRIAKYWKDEYDWRKAEVQLNELPNYMTTIDIDGFDPVELHFIHQKSKTDNAIPLLFVHGWPGSFIEVTKLLPLFADSEKNGGPAFHVVAPSLPNFGFSGVIKKKGFGQKQYAETFHKLMLSLGYDQYVSQGGDWGFAITRIMGLMYPQHLKASHINMIPCYPPLSLWTPIAFARFLFTHLFKLYTPTEKKNFERTQQTQDKGSGYRNLQNTKPQTIGYSLADSPVALLAWIYEKLHDWTDDYPWTDDEICTWVSIYAFSRAGPAASVRIYYESERGEYPAWTKGIEYIPNVKLGLSWFPKELVLLPQSWARTLGPIVYKKEHAKGGHFAAFENPEALVGDLRIMFGKGGGAYGVVEGKIGYA